MANQKEERTPSPFPPTARLTHSLCPVVILSFCIFVLYICIIIVVKEGVNEMTDLLDCYHHHLSCRQTEQVSSQSTT